MHDARRTRVVRRSVEGTKRLESVLYARNTVYKCTRYADSVCTQLPLGARDHAWSCVLGDLDWRADVRLRVRSATPTYQGCDLLRRPATAKLALHDVTQPRMPRQLARLRPSRSRPCPPLGRQRPIPPPPTVAVHLTADRRCRMTQLGGDRSKRQARRQPTRDLLPLDQAQPPDTASSRRRSDPTAAHQIGTHRALRQSQLTRSRFGRHPRRQSLPDRIQLLRLQPHIPTTTTHHNLLKFTKCGLPPVAWRHRL